MTNLDVLSILDEIVQERLVLTYAHIEHPAKSWSLEDRLLYLQTLALVLIPGKGINDTQESCLKNMIQAMGMDVEQTLAMLKDFIKAPEKLAVLAFFSAFRETDNTFVFLFDCFVLNLFWSNSNGHFNKRQ